MNYLMRIANPYIYMCRIANPTQRPALRTSPRTEHPALRTSPRTESEWVYGLIKKLDIETSFSVYL